MRWFSMALHDNRWAKINSRRWNKPVWYSYPNWEYSPPRSPPPDSYGACLRLAKSRDRRGGIRAKTSAYMSEYMCVFWSIMSAEVIGYSPHTPLTWQKYRSCKRHMRCEETSGEEKNSDHAATQGWCVKCCRLEPFQYERQKQIKGELIWPTQEHKWYVPLSVRTSSSIVVLIFSHKICPYTAACLLQHNVQEAENKNKSSTIINHKGLTTTSYFLLSPLYFVVIQGKIYVWYDSYTHAKLYIWFVVCMCVLREVQ